MKMAGEKGEERGVVEVVGRVDIEVFRQLPMVRIHRGP